MSDDRNCGCQDTTITYTQCSQCSPQTDCDCPITDLGAECVLYKGDDIQCNGVAVVLKNINLADNLKNIVDYNCNKFSEIQGYFQLENIGNGIQIYSGESLLGKKQLRTLTKSGNLILLSQSTNEINITIDEGNLTEFVEGLAAVVGFQDSINNDGSVSGNALVSLENDSNLIFYKPNGVLLSLSSVDATEATFGRLYIGIGDGSAQPYVGLMFFDETTKFRDSKNNTGIQYFADYSANFTDLSLVNKKWVLDVLPVIDGSETKINAGTNISISGSGTTGSPYIITATGSDGSETKINPGTNIGVSGLGTIASPYIISSTIDGSETKVNAGTNISISGSGTAGSPYIINNTMSAPDGSETKINSGTTTSVTGSGTTASPYVIETVNLQKAITTSYALTSADNNYSIKVNNGSTPVTITVPAGLPQNFFVGITQKGTADVTIVGSSTTISNPVGFKIEGQGFHVGIEQIGSTNAFDLLGNTKA